MSHWTFLTFQLQTLQTVPALHIPFSANQHLRPTYATKLSDPSFLLPPRPFLSSPLCPNRPIRYPAHSPVIFHTVATCHVQWYGLLQWPSSTLKTLAARPQTRDPSLTPCTVGNEPSPYSPVPVSARGNEKSVSLDRPYLLCQKAPRAPARFSEVTSGKMVSKSYLQYRRLTYSLSGHAAGFSHTVTPSTVDGVNLEEIKRFAKLFKMKRLSLGLTQTQVGQTLSLTNGPAYSQSAICRYGPHSPLLPPTPPHLPHPTCRFEKLDITPKSAQKIKPVLERWLQEVDDQIKVNGGVANMQRTFLSPVRLESKPIHDDPPSTPLQLRVSPANSSPPSRSVQPAETASPETVLSPGAVSCTDAAANCKRRKRRTSFTPQALEVLNEYFDRNSHPSGISLSLAPPSLLSFGYCGPFQVSR